MSGNSRDPRRLALVVFGILLAAIIAVLVAIPAADRKLARDMAAAYTPLGCAQETALDACQAVPYVVALVVCAFMLVRLWHRRDRLPLWVGLAAVTAWLFWRELPYDEQWLGCNTFSWATYASHAHDAPLWIKATFLAVSVGFMVGMVVYVVVMHRAVWRLAREKIGSLSSLLLALSVVALGVAYAIDKHRLADRALGTNLTAWDLKDYCEESLEIIGPVLLAMACIMADLEEPPAEGAP